MSDLALRWDIDAGDLAMESNDIAVDEGLETAVILSLACDRRANEGDTLPDGSANPRGWWGDTFAPIAADQVGSRLWLLSRSKQEPGVLRQAEAFALEALRWMLDDHVASAVTVKAEFTPQGWLGLAVSIVRPFADPVAFRFALNWSGQAAKG